MSTPPRRLVTAERRDDDVAETSLRPQRLSEFIGQEQARANLSVFIEAARARNEALDHVLFVGPPGLGKTTLAQIVSRELGVNFRATSGPVIAKAGDLAALLTNLEERDVLFIDEIHRLNPAVEEILYPAMEDFQLDLIIGEGPAARSVKIDLAKFTLVGATTRAGLLTNPLRDRFGIPMRLNFYTEAELELIVKRGARVLGIGMTPDGANEIARRSRGTPRIAGRLLRRVRDFAHVDGADSDRPQARRQGAARSSKSMPPASTRWTGAISRTIADELRRRAGRRRDHRRRAVGAARRDRGDHRAVPDPEGLPAAHAARPAADRRMPSSISASPSRRAIRRSSDCSAAATRTSEAIADADLSTAAAIAAACAFEVTADLDRRHLSAIARSAARRASLHLIVPPAQFELFSGEDDLADLSVQHRASRKHTFCKRVRRASVLCAALRSGQDRRQRALPRRHRRRRAVAEARSTASNWEGRDRQTRRARLAMSDIRARRRDPRRPASACRCGSITRTPISPASSITPAICASWSAAAPTICACSAPTSARCSSEAEKEAPGFAFVVRSMPIDFLQARARWTTCCEIVTAPVEVKGASIMLHQRVMRGDEMLVEAPVQVAFVSGGRARPIPKPLRSPCRPIRTLPRQAERRLASPTSTLAAPSCKRSSHELVARTAADGPRGYHHGNLKEALIRAALELIAEKGPAGFTFAEAARWAGVSPAAPYRHFRDRDELLADVARRGFELFEAALRARLGRRPARSVRRRSSGSARPISLSPATSRPITRRCSRPAFRSTPIRTCARPATAPSRVLRSATEAADRDHAGAAAARRP